jgi:hypothetical protein
MKSFKDLREKTLTPAEKKKREEIAKAMERENPGMDMKKKMAIATWQAKKVAEETELDEGLYHVSYGVGLDHQVVAKDASDAHQKAMSHFKKTKPKLNDPKYSDTFNKKTITRIKGDEPRSDKYKTEEVELDEISRDLARRYIRKVADKTNTGELSTKEVEKRRPGVHLAGKKAYPAIAGKAKVSATEAVEPIDEISKKTLGSYVKKSADDLTHIQRDITSGSVKDPEYKSLSRMRKNRKAGIARAVTSLTKEQAEDDMPASPDEKSMAMSQAKFIEYVAEEIKEYIKKDKPFPEWMQNKLSSLHENAKDMHAVLAGDYEDEDEMEESVTTSPLQKIRMDKEKADRNKDDKDKSQAKRMTDKQYAGYKVKMKEEAVQSADRKPEKYVRPDGKVGIRMIKVDKKVIKND